MTDDAAAAFIRETQWHGSLERANAILAQHPEVARASIITAAILGDAATVAGFVEADRTSATARGGPFQRDPLTHLCFSRYLRLDRKRTPDFVRAATILLDAGASPSTGFYDESHKPDPCFESVLYGAAGVAHHPELTRLLVERGADPNDAPAFEVPYHAPETYDNRALAVLVETGKLSAWSLNMMLVRKADWHDGDGALYLMQHGANPDLDRDRGWQVLPHAIERDNALTMIRHLLEHGANPHRVRNGITAEQIAARRGRGDVLRLFAERGFGNTLTGALALAAACARGDSAEVAVRRQEQASLDAILQDGGQLIVEFAGNGNGAGIDSLLSLGVPVDARFAEGDGYWEVAPGTTALMNAAWRMQLDTVDLLLRRGADVNLRNSKGRSALDLALHACTGSYWAGRRSPRSIAQLLDAGADASHITLPTGFPEADALLQARRR